jgi:hypothetical protein
MSAFLKTADKGIYKAYIIGTDDIQVKCPTGEEYWFSQHSDDINNKRQLSHAIEQSCRLCKDTFIKNDIVLI